MATAARVLGRWLDSPAACHRTLQRDNRAAREPNPMIQRLLAAASYKECSSIGWHGGVVTLAIQSNLDQMQLRLSKYTILERPSLDTALWRPNAWADFDEFYVSRAP
ncbi:hypothetical protein EVAR_70264_1 [Eumeta japonica]|uniref:Uncharacterized protein n=1 Tax=Eumeta variegata TaxID=151549 RepID=A0A4C2AC84_EUMVA|nr:hypothetical protein EVAR_70264_1 [Eumeta japonica]